MTDIDPDQGRLEGGGRRLGPPGPPPAGLFGLIERPPSLRRHPPLGLLRHSPGGAHFISKLAGTRVLFWTVPGAPPTTKSAAWRWILYALGGFLVGQLVGGLFGVVAGDMAGKNATQMAAITSAAIPPEWYVISTLIGLWVGFLRCSLVGQPNARYPPFPV